ncbi:MAG: TrbC/VirB2 family protein [Synergistaceae bacterium]|nr:TrbC/VirB2 family protein [Synergistaceae bacterium]MBQ3626654.1 TrbC/VirB2 family protein [Synergistaceae bacterium]MBQ6740899.1 TrbC/VirB2 family protein [Synergistaceae bacterium]MBQ6909835.1 TrbC/VirB2 family protein [Synergistaceae bacterium]MBQ7569513.1 TrbC/VirB2 family protein [Synergistaceae bacterium]
MLNSKFSVSKWLFDRRAAVFAAVLLLAVLCLPMAALAKTDSVAWNTGIEKLIDALSGKTALLISMVGLFFAGGMLIFGGQLGGFGRSVMMVVLVGSMLGALTSVVKLFVSSEGMLLL